jgi:hypothetical protein
MNSYEKDGAAKWDEYMRATSAFLDCGLPNFIEEKLDLLSFPSFLTEALRDFGKVRPLNALSSFMIGTQNKLMQQVWKLIIGMASEATLRCP